MAVPVSDASRGCDGCRGEIPATDGIGRRTFLAQTALVAAAAMLAACGVASDVGGPNLSGPVTIKISDYPALASVGGMAMVTVQGNPMAVVRTSSSTFVALSRICPHQGSTVNQNGSGFLCPNHGAQFNATGTWVGGQRTGNMTSFATTYDSVAGTISIS